MRSDTTQLDWIRNAPPTVEQLWEAYESCCQQFPHDERRKAHYRGLAEAAEIERDRRAAA